MRYGGEVIESFVDEEYFVLYLVLYGEPVEMVKNGGDVLFRAGVGKFTGS